MGRFRLLSAQMGNRLRRRRGCRRSTEDTLGCGGNAEVIAWMPLPEPFGSKK